MIIKIVDNNLFKTADVVHEDYVVEFEASVVLKSKFFSDSCYLKTSLNDVSTLKEGVNDFVATQWHG